MEYRSLGRNGPSVPVLGFGAWPIGGGLGKVERSTAIDTVRAAIDEGGTLLDTAEGYRSSEGLIGEALAGVPRDRCFLATKVSMDFSPIAVRTALERSLRALRTDYVDLYQVHCWKPEYPIELTMEEMLRLHREGKVRFLGVSNFLPEHMERAMRVCPIQSNQVRYSLLFREIEQGTISFCRERGVGIIVHSPLAKGLLTGRYAAGAAFPADDERSGFPEFKGERFAAYLERAGRLGALARKKGLTLVQLAIAWTLADTTIACTLAGAKSPEQVREHLGAVGVSFSDRELAEIDAALAG